MNTIKTNKIINLTKTENGLYKVDISDNILVLDEETVLKYRLFKDNEISNEELNKIQYDDLVYKVSNKMLEYGIRYSKSINEIKRHFLNKDIDKEIVFKAVDILIQKGIIDDKKLALLIGNSLARNSNGYYLIKEKLKQKLFNEEDINYALEMLSFEDIVYGKEKLLTKLEKKYSKEDLKIKNIKIKKQLYNHGYKVDD